MKPILETQFKKLESSLSKKKEIKKIFFISQSSNENDSKSTWFFEILLREDFLNEKDIDLFDVEFFVEFSNQNEFAIRMEFYSSDGTIFKKRQTGFQDLSSVNDNLSNFINEIIVDYDLIIRHYTIQSDNPIN